MYKVDICLAADFDEELSRTSVIDLFRALGIHHFKYISVRGYLFQPLPGHSNIIEITPRTSFVPTITHHGLTVLVGDQ